MENLLKTIGAFLGFVGLMVVWVLVTTLPVQILWNLLVPELFGLPKLGFWQTFGLLVLVNLIFNRSTTKKNDK